MLLHRPLYASAQIGAHYAALCFGPKHKKWTSPGSSWGPYWFGTCTGPCPPLARSWYANTTWSGRCAIRIHADCALWRGRGSPGWLWCRLSPIPPVDLYANHFFVDRSCIWCVFFKRFCIPCIRRGAPIRIEKLRLCPLLLLGLIRVRRILVDE